MRRYVTILCAVLVVGCQSPKRSHNGIADSLKSRMTPDEARQIIFDHIDQAIKVAQTRSAADEDVRTELAVLSKHRQRLSSEFHSFLIRSRAGDELWDYRTYVTADHRGGERGFALVRDGRVVEHMEIITYD
jgi:hypothetical protein